MSNKFEKFMWEIIKFTWVGASKSFDSFLKKDLVFDKQ